MVKGIFSQKTSRTIKKTCWGNKTLRCYAQTTYSYKLVMPSASMIFLFIAGPSLKPSFYSIETFPIIVFLVDSLFSNKNRKLTANK
jgi:hypothetical protein